MPTAPKAFLFDLDGTLLDTAPEFTACINALLQEENLPFITEAELRPAVSQGARGMLNRAFQNTPTLDTPLLRQRFLDRYQATLGSLTQFFAGMENCLNRLNNAGIPWGIVTNKPTAFTLPLIEKFPLLKTAQCVVSGDTLAVHKPHPDPLLLGASLLKIPPHHCWYVGDAQTDVEASHAAGMRCIVAHYGYIPPQENPQSWEADGYVNHPEEIFDKSLAP